jgi:hypothetical protein
MDERLLAYYNSELRFVREMAGEFAREFPKIAGRLALDRDAKDICPDPYVERLLELCISHPTHVTRVPRTAFCWSAVPRFAARVMKLRVSSGRLTTCGSGP